MSHETTPQAFDRLLSWTDTFERMAGGEYDLPMAQDDLGGPCAPSAPYRTPIEMPEEAPPSSRKPRARMLSALATLSARRGGKAAEELAARASSARSDEQRRFVEQAAHLRRAAQRAFAACTWTTAEGFYRRLLAEPQDTLDPRDVTGDLIGLATILRVLGQTPESEPIFQCVLRAGLVDLPRPFPACMGHEVGVLLMQVGRSSEAQTILEGALDVARSEGDSRQVARISIALAYLASDGQRRDAATAHAEEALRVSANAFGVDGPEHAAALTVSARAHREEGRRATAQRLIRLACDTLDRTAAPSRELSDASAFVLDELAESALALQLPDDAIGFAAKAVALIAQSKGEHPALLHPLRTRARVLRALGQPRAAAADEVRCAVILRAWSPPQEPG